MANLMSMEEVSSLTVPKLKAELTRLNQPIGGLKRKADLVKALTTYIEQQQQQQQQQQEDQPHEEGPPAAPAAASSPTAIAAAAEQEAESAPDSTSLPAAEPGASEEPEAEIQGQKEHAAKEQVDPVDTAVSDVPTEQAEPAQAPTPDPPATPGETPTRKSRKRAGRGDKEGTPPGKSEASAGTGTGTGTKQQSSPSQVPSPAAKRKKVAETTDAAEKKAPQPQPQPQPQPSGGGGAEMSTEGEKSNGNGTSAKEAARENEAPTDDPMDEEKVAPASEPGSADPVVAVADAGEGADGAAAGVTPAPVVKESAGASGTSDAGGGDGGDAGGGGGVADGDGGDKPDDKEEKGNGEAADPVTIRVDNFVRPFTAPQAKKLLEDKAGAPILEGGFWMDSIKTHCYATFSGREAAERAMAALQGLQWPVQSFKRLEAKIGDMSAEEARARDDAKRSNRPLSAKKRPAPVLGPRVTPDAKGAIGAGGSGVKANGTSAGAGDSSASSATGGIRVRGRGSVQAPGVPGSKGGVLAANVEVEVGRGRQHEIPQPQRLVEEEPEPEPEPIVLDDMFRKTVAKPSLYWMPLLEEEVGERKKKMAEDGVGPRTTPMPADHVDSLGGGRGARGSRGSGGGGGGGGGWSGGGWGRRSGGGGGYARQAGYGRRR